ncbi:leucine-rich repeat-containing protein 27-like [Dunckerocampus dactyliophorus]|uniref:leucine-rich repeat-containing protein 27-like n=1 Tax=Dunckerocampus dactyliophorus TaxID=161453 RepID=UPI002405AD39|nr:leucine-rich repeat-containing protein 27-like [Dunckerocampus dactyliophorus]
MDRAGNIPPSVAEDAEHNDCHSLLTLCWSRTGLKHVSESILKHNQLKYLYLEGNQIHSLPNSMFTDLPNLLWLDLRNNQVGSLPAEIGLHKSLQTLLLEENPISELPSELGNLVSLKGLNLRKCPITFPPPDIVHEGLQSILHYLRRAMVKQPESGTPPALPKVENLQLSDLAGSSMEEHDGSVDADQPPQFKQHRHKGFHVDKAYLSSMVQGNPNLHHLLFIKRKKVTAKASVNRESTLFHNQDWKRPKERRHPAMTALEDKQSILKPRKKITLTWCSKPKSMQQKSQVGQERQTKEVDDNSSQPRSKTSDSSIKWPEEHSSDEKHLEWQISAHADEKKMQRGVLQRDTAAMHVASAHQGGEECQKKLPIRGGHNGNYLAMFTEDMWPFILDK